MEEIREKLKRPAIVFEIGGVKDSDDPLESWFGKVNVCSPGEVWPSMDGAPMRALCQINLANLPFRLSGLTDIEFIALFIGPKELPSNAPNGQNWCLRTYQSLSALVPIGQPDLKSMVKAFPMRPRVVEEDFPCREDLPFDIPESVQDNYEDLFSNVSGLKLGGWPTLIQSEIFWAPWNQHPAAPEYVFQVDSESKANWNWGDGGVGYFGRGTAKGKEDDWACEWQCY